MRMVVVVMMIVADVADRRVESSPGNRVRSGPGKYAGDEERW